MCPMNKKILYLIAALVVFGIGGYFLYTRLNGVDVTTVGQTTKPVEMSFKTQIFSDQKFSDLVKQITLPIKVSQKGKANPFMKF